ncbi:RHS repeat protein, partial [Yersinia pestis]
WGQSRRYQYNAVGHLTGSHDPLGQILAVTCDKLGRITEKNIAGDEQAWERYEYNVQGQLIGAVNPAVTVTRRYNQDGQLAQEIQQQPQVSATVEYGYNAAGQQVEQRHLLQYADEDDIQVQQRIRYGYDVLGQIVGYQDPLGTLHRYRYDACGDRFSTVADNAEGRHTQQDNGTAYQLDKAGQLVSRTDRFSQLALRWNTFGRLAGIKNEHHDHAYTYDALGRRVGKRHLQRPTKLLDGLRVIDKETPSRGEPVWQDETWFMWDGDVMVGELQREVAPRVVTPETWDKPDGIVYSGQFYVYQPDSFEPRAMQRYQQIAEAEDGEIAPLGEEQIYFYQNDPNGMPIRLQDGEGEVVWEAQFTPFGQLSVTGTSQLRQPLRMQGQYYDTESGLHYNRYRYYDPACGVFISQDPIGLKGGLNPYQFAVNTLGWVDPLGLWKKRRNNGQFAKKPGRKKTNLVIQHMEIAMILINQQKGILCVIVISVMLRNMVKQLKVRRDTLRSI